MSLYPNFETSTLVELLAQHTERLTELFTKGTFGREYEQCKKMIEDLQIEIDLRHKNLRSQNNENKMLTKINLTR